jgi:hypothetical protein
MTVYFHKNSIYDSKYLGYRNVTHFKCTFAEVLAPVGSKLVSRLAQRHGARNVR